MLILTTSLPVKRQNEGGDFSIRKNWRQLSLCGAGLFSFGLACGEHKFTLVERARCILVELP